MTPTSWPRPARAPATPSVQASTTTALTLSAASSVYGLENSQVFTATVSPQVSGTPTGTVNVVQGSTVLCTITLAGGTGTCSPSATALGAGGSPYTVKAVYGGDANFGGSTSANKTWAITLAPLTLTLAPSATTVVYGNEQTVTYSVSFGSALPAPTGTVAVTSGSTPLCTVLLTGGAGTCTVTSPTALAVSATNPVVATYTGDTNYPGTVTSANPVNLAVTRATTTTVLSVTPASVTYGAENAAVIGVGVTPQFSGTPTGTVTVTSGATTVCTVTLPATTCSPSATAFPVTGGPYALTATYSGDTNFGPSSVVNTPGLSVTRAGSTTALTVVPSSVAYGNEHAAVFTVTASSQTTGTPTGTVVVATGATTLCTVTLASGTGTCQIPTGTQTLLPVGPYGVVGHLRRRHQLHRLHQPGGDPHGHPGLDHHHGGLRPVHHHPRERDGRDLHPDPDRQPGRRRLAHRDGHHHRHQHHHPCGHHGLHGAGRLGHRGHPVLARLRPAAAPGSYTVAASYPGDPNFTASSGTAPGTLTVAPASSSSLTLGLTPSATTVVYGNEQTVTYSVNFGAAFPPPTGTVAITTGTTTLCTVTLLGGTGSCAITPPTALPVSATNPIVATYGGDANYSGTRELHHPGEPGRHPGGDHHRAHALQDGR